MKWIKTSAQQYISDNGQYAIVGRYTYYQGWTPCYLPNGTRGEWTSIDGMYKGKGALQACRELCNEHARRA